MTTATNPGRVLVIDDEVELMKALAVTNPAVPVLLMSAYAPGELADMGVVAPCGVVPKPFPAERLLQEVRHCLGKRREREVSNHPG